MNEPRDQAHYNINTDIAYGPLELIDVGAMAPACPRDWFHRTLCRVNDTVIRLGILHGEFHWHVHERKDEFFYVVDGRLLVDLAEATFALGPGQALTVPQGVRHRTRAPERTQVLMVEAAGVTPTGDG